MGLESHERLTTGVHPYEDQRMTGASSDLLGIGRPKDVFISSGASMQ